MTCVILHYQDNNLGWDSFNVIPNLDSWLEEGRELYAPFLEEDAQIAIEEEEIAVKASQHSRDIRRVSLAQKPKRAVPYLGRESINYTFSCPVNFIKNLCFLIKMKS
jgi:hypothetical protein